MRSQSIFLVLALVLICPFSIAQWVQTNGPHRSYVQCFAVKGTNIFAGTRNLGGNYGVFRSTNNGVSWAQTGLMNHEIWSLAVSGSNIFAGTYGDGVFLSTDDGDSWSLVNGGLTDVRALAISGTNIFAGTPGSGVFLSTNNGASWTQTGLYEWVNALAISGTNIFAATDTGGIYLSTNNGVTWKQSKSNRGWVVALTVTDSCVFASSAQVYCTTNNGVSWTESKSGLPEAAFVGALAVSGRNIYAGTSSGVYVSNDNGENWQETGLRNEDVTALEVTGKSLFAGTLYSGVHLSLDAGASWSWSGFPITTVNALAVSDTILFAGTQEGVCLSTTSGSSWVQTNGPNPFGIGFTDVLAMAVSGVNLIVAGCTAEMYGCSFGLYLSTDNGTSWSKSGNPPPAGGSKWSGPQVCLVASGTNLFAGGSGVSLSTDEGMSWQDANNGLPKAQDDTSRYVQIMSLASNGAILVAGTVGGVFLSTNSGANWTQTGLHEGVNALAFSGENIYAGTDTAGIFRATGTGATWSKVNNGLARNPFDTTKYVPITTLFPNGATLFAGSPGNGVFLSNSDGSNWTEVNTGLTSLNIKSLVVCRTNLFAGTYGGGVWQRPLSEMIPTSVSTPPEELPSTYTLEQNYPNPFNPSTTVTYELPRSSLVTLSVYDILGREVSLLVNEKKDAGVHEVKFDASGLASGVYFYRMTAGSFVQTRKLLLIR